MKRTGWFAVGKLFVVSVIISCSGSTSSLDGGDAPTDAGTATDGGPRDAGTANDAGSGDAGTVTDAGSGDAGAATDAGSGDAGSAWSPPQSLVDDIGRLAIGNHVHLVGHLGGQLVHRRSIDNGATWTSPVVIAPAAGNFPGMYGGLVADGDSVYLITANDDMASSASVGGRPLSFRKSSDNGATWSAPVQVTTTPIFRARMAARGSFIHVAGVGNPTSNPTYWYFRSTNGGTTWTATALATNLGTYGGGQTIAVDPMTGTVHAAYTDANGSIGAGPTWYRRSTDNGMTWSLPVSIGENTAQSSRQARVQLTAADGRVFASWQREPTMSGGTLPADRIGYNRSADDGQTWGTAQVLPGDTGVDRNHQHVWMASGGGVHFVWRHGDSGDSTPDPAGYMFSPDYGATWGPRIFAVDTTATLGSNHPWSIVANARAVHVLTGPSGAMQLSSKPIP